MKNNQKWKVEEIKKEDIIIPDDIMRPLQDEKDDDIVGLSTSFNSNGMINEIDIRESKTVRGKYELMAGARRFVATKGDTILAKVFKNVSDLRAMIIGYSENEQRKNPDTNVRDAFAYKIWKKGKKDGDFKCIQDMAKELGMDGGLLGMIIYAGELKEKDQSIIIQRATTHDINDTRDLSEHPDLRQDLLKKKQDNKITSDVMGKISGEIKNELNSGTEKDVVKKVLSIVDSTNVRKDIEKIVENVNTIHKDVNTDDKVCDSPKISDKKFADTLNTYKKSPLDIQEKLEKREIDVGEAKLLNQFDTPERRDKVLNDLKVAEEVHDWDKKKTVDTRLKQQEQLNNKGETDLKTRQDRAYEEELKKESNKDQLHDQRYLDRYQRMSSYIIETVSGFHPRTLKTDEVKKKAAKIFRGNYELLYSILVEMGEIEKIIEEDTADKEN